MIPTSGTPSLHEPKSAVGDAIREVRGVLAPDLSAVDREIERVLASETDLTREVGDYVQNSRGKQLRPILLILSAWACGRRDLAVHQTAAALEIVHNASLLHDDVIDRSDLRRGRPTVNARFGDNVAILMADFLYSHAFRLALECLDPKVLQMITRVTAEMCESELFQIEREDVLLTEADYYRIIKGKTAYLFGACCGLGAILARRDEETVEALSRFGLSFGLAFQITDDVLDYTADDEMFGKAVGTDIEGGRQTLPLIHALEVADEATRERLLALVGVASTPDSTREVIRIVRESGGIEYSLEAARRHINESVEGLAVIGRGPGLDWLHRLADFMLARTY
jgi:octaprenyl-diphosphate synthase